MLARYLISLLLSLGIVCGFLARLPFVTLSQVTAGTSFEETWTANFTLPAITQKGYYLIEGKMKDYLEKGLKFVGTGAARVRSATFKLNQTRVEVGSRKSPATAPGASLVAQVAWEVPADSADGEKGAIHIVFPPFADVQRVNANFYSERVQKTGEEWVFREVTAYRSDSSLALGRYRFASVAGLSIVFFLHGIWWLFMIVKERRARLAALGQLSGSRPGCSFWPSPTGAWWGWTITLVLFHALGALWVGISISRDFMSVSFDFSMMTMQVISVVVAVVVVFIAMAKEDTATTNENRLVTGHWMKASPASKPLRYNGNALSPMQFIAELHVPFTLRCREATRSWQSAQEVLATEEVRDLFDALAQATGAGVEPKGRLGGHGASSYRIDWEREISEEVWVKGSMGLWFDDSFPTPFLEVNSDFRLIHQASETIRDGAAVRALLGLTALELLAGGVAVYYHTEFLPTLLVLFSIGMVVKLAGLIVWHNKHLHARRVETTQMLNESYLKPDAPGVAEFRQFAEGVLHTLRAAKGVSVGEVVLASDLAFPSRPSWLEGIDAELQLRGRSMQNEFLKRQMERY